MDGNRLSTTRSSSSLIIIHSGSPLFFPFLQRHCYVPKMGEDEWGARCLRLLDACRIRILSRKKKGSQERAIWIVSNIKCGMCRIRFLRCLQRWKEECLKKRQTCDRVEEHEVLKIRDLPALPLLSHVG